MNGKQLDITKYRKLTWDQVKSEIEILKDYNNITRTKLTELFSHQMGEMDSTGEIIVKEPKFLCTDYFDLPANVLPNQPKPVESTTFGIFIFNALCIAFPFKTKIPYMNVEMDAKNFGKLNKAIGHMLINKQINVDEFGLFTDTVLWLGYQTELFMPGASLGTIVPNARVQAEKKRILKEHPEFTDGSSVDSTTAAKYIDEVEKPLLKIAKEELAKDPSGRMYNLKKPGIGNNYKNSNITNGPLPDMMNQGNYIIVDNSFTDGTDRKSYATLSNKALFASYSRGVATQRGGTYAKYISIMMQSVRADKPGTNCGTTSYVNFEVTDENKSTIEFCYALLNGKLVELTEDILKTLVGKTIKLRSPIFCKDKKCICNICLGNKPYKMGIENIGMVANIPADKVKNASMKRMHNMAMDTIVPPITDFFNFEY